MRRLVRHHFQGSQALSFSYDVITFLITQTILPFGLAFDLMLADRSITFWRWVKQYHGICHH